MKKTGVLGGTFNPVHTAHLRVAEEVREALGLERVLFVPVNLPPHKEDSELAGAEARLRMVELAIRGNQFFEASDIEIKRPGPSYTIDTVEALAGTGLDPTIITGADQFGGVAGWCRCEDLFEAADFAVVGRPGFAAKKIAEVLPVELARKFWYDNETDSYVHPSGHRVSYVGTALLDISSSAVRSMVREGRSIKYLVPPDVERYVLEHGLYREGGKQA